MKTLLFSPRRAPFVVGGILAVPLLLSGCATTPKPAVSPGLSPQAQALDHSIAQIHQVALSLRTADHPYDGFPLPAGGKTPACTGLNPDSPLAEPLTVQWSGKASVLLSGIAARWGWSFENRLGRDQTDPDVSIYTHHAKAADVLAEVARQTPADTLIKVMPGLIVLEDR